MSILFFLAYVRAVLADCLTMSSKMILRDIDREMKYYTRREMEENKITIRNGLLFYKRMPLTTRLPGMIYVLTQNHQLIVGVPQHDIVHHSTIAGGEPVLCAGEIITRDGRLIAVNTRSGHYAPSNSHLVYLMSYLERMNIDITDVIVKYHD